MTIAYPHGDLIPVSPLSNPVLNPEQPRRKQSDIVESDSENHTQGTNDTGSGCTDGESDEEETEFETDEGEMEGKWRLKLHCKLMLAVLEGFAEALHWEMKSSS